MVRPEKIRSLNDIRMEKLRLKLEIMKTEESISSAYREILQALTFKNIASAVVSDISATSSVVAKAISIGKAVLTGRKKKKHDKMKEATGEPGIGTGQ